jgi:hypothetical protein
VSTVPFVPYDNDARAIEFGTGINAANEAYRQLHGGANIPYDPGMISVQAQRADWDFYMGDLPWPTSRDKHLNEYRDEYGLPHVQPAPPGPFTPAPRFWKGNMCGTRVAGLPPVDGGAADPSLVLSWFYDRYTVSDRMTIRTAWQSRNLTHVLLSWPDSRTAGYSIEQFRAMCQELIGEGFYPCVMLSSKDHDPKDVNAIMNGLVPVLQRLVGLVPMFCVGWELSLWLSPTQVQQLIDRISPIVKAQAGTLLYVHFQEGYPSFQQPGGTVADFWNPNVGKLDGLLYQKLINQNDAQFLDSLNDCLQRFGGGFNMAKGFDFVGLELSAMTQFNGTCSEAEGNRIGTLAINAPKVNGVGVSGSGNGLQG